jgi:hypothetical protein
MNRIFYTEYRLFINTLTKFALPQVTCHFVFLADPKLLLHTKQVINITEQRGSIILLSRLMEFEFS